MSRNPNYFVSPRKGFIPGLGVAGEGFLGSLLAGLSGLRQGGIVGAANQAYQVNALNKQYQQAQAERQRKLDEQTASEDELERLYRQTNDPRLQNIRKTKPSDVKTITEMYGVGDYNQGANQFYTGEMPETWGFSDPNQVRQTLEGGADRMAEIRDTQETLKRLENPGFIYGSPIGQTILAQSAGMTPGGTPMLQQDPLQGGVNQDNLNPANAYSIGIPNVGQLQTGWRDVKTDERGQATQKERERHNRESEAHNQRQEAIGWYNAKTARMKPSGGSGNPYTVPNAQQTYLKNQLRAVDAQLNAMGIETGKDDKLKMREQTQAKEGGFLGFGGVSADTAAQNQRINALLQRRDEILQGIYGVGSTPFGGQSQRKVQQAGDSVKPQKRLHGVTY